MKNILTLVLLALLPMAASAKMKSPNGLLSMKAQGNSLVMLYKGTPMLHIAQWGFQGDSPSTIQAAMSHARVTRVEADYQMIAGKRLHCTNQANEYRLALSPRSVLVVRLYDDGLAFRYELSGLQGGALPHELTAYRIAEGQKRWMQQWSDAYEGFFPQATTARQKPVPTFGQPAVSAEGYNCRWGFPALIEPADGLFVLLTEANVERMHSAACLWNDTDAELFRVVPDDNPSIVSGSWHTPWRIAIAGTLDRVVESTLVTDVSQECRLADVSWIHPGVVSWIYWAHNHGSNDYDIIRQYVDMAVSLQLPYVLIDAEWDEMKNGHTIEEAIAYARERGVKPMIWYNSSVGWVDGAPGPKYRLNKPEDREREFAWCEQLGVAGVKIDFFSGDTWRNMDYCLDLLESAARHHLLVNFHGATIPRGWQRTYPHLLTTEAVYGAEWYNNVATFTTRAAAHNATLPFTRNVVGPMDYTPCAFSDSQHPHITTHAHELALTVLFESGLQHLADRPESFLAQPREVQQFLGQLPTTWDETRLLSGYPGHHAVMARRRGNTWYVAGINGTDAQISVSLPATGGWAQGAGMLFADADPWSIQPLDRLPASITLEPRGGFVWVGTNR